MKKRIFGFDLGIASIGWAVVDFDNEYYDIETGEVIEGRILKSGVRMFPVAENPKDGSSLAAPRREKRGARRLCRRKARRLQGIKSLFIKNGLVKDENELKKIYANQIGGDVWDLRVKGVSEQLTKEELVRVFTHLAKHRGFKSYRKAVEEKDEEGGKVLRAIKQNAELLGGDMFQTLAQAIVAKGGKKRNRAIKDENGKVIETIYDNSISRKEIEKEADLLFEYQKQFGIITDKMYHGSEDSGKGYKYIAFRHRPVGEIEDMIGYCQFEKGERRAAKEAPSSELFVALGKINNLTVYENDEKRFLSSDERSALLNLLKTTQKVKYSSINSKIFKGKEIRFSDINYSKNTKTAKDGTVKTINPEDTIFYEMKGWHKLKSVFSEEEWKILEQDIVLLDKVVYAIASKKNDVAITKELERLELSYDLINKFLSIDSDKFINLSFVALYKIIPFMEQGLKYNEACEKAGYDFKGENKIVDKKGALLEVIPNDKLTKVPVVNRTIAQFRKVYNALVRQYGVPDQINIETGRDLKKTHDERRELEKKNKENQESRSEAQAELLNKNMKGNSTNILKYRLYQEQDCKCIYSGKVIDINRLDEDGYLDIDHIIPYSRSLDNSYNNKVLCLSEENRKKSNKTPFEYIKKEDWDEFKGRVNSMHAMNNRKKDNLLITNFVDREQEFRERNSNDNNYIARYVKQYLEDGVDFSLSSRQDIKNRVQMRTGTLTDYLRHCWGLEKDRGASDKHHAQDAIVIACATPNMVKYLSTVSGCFEDKWKMTKEKGDAWYKKLKHKFKEPWTGFRDDVLESLDNIFVSRPPRKSATGEVHQETIRTINPQHKKYSEKDVTSGIKMRGGLANNGTMLRTDVFVKKNKKGKDEFYMIPIYLSNLGGLLPDKAIVSGKNEADWVIIDDSFDFKFSIYMDDLIKLTKKDKVIYGYFKGTDRCLGQVTVEAHDRSFLVSSIGVKTQDSFQKYAVDVLGNVIEIKQEKRLPLTLVKSNSQRHKERMEKKQQKG